MRWVLITPFGMPVEPEVKRILATLSGPTLANAASTSAPGGVASRSPKGVAARPGGGLALTTSSMPSRSRASSALAKRAPSAANTSPGVTSSKMWRSFAWSCDISE